MSNAILGYAATRSDNEALMPYEGFQARAYVRLRHALMAESATRLRY